MKKFNLIAACIVAVMAMLCTGCSDLPFDFTSENSGSESYIELRFYANGGSYNGSSVSSASPAYTAKVKDGTSYSFSTVSSKFTRSGYTLLGWSKSSTATTATYSATSSNSFYSSNGTSVNLYAVWKSNSSSSTGTILNDKITVSKQNYSSKQFTLSKASKVTVSMSSTNTMYYYLIPSSSFTNFKNGKTFTYYSSVSSSTTVGKKSISGSVTLTAGTYYYICQNKGSSSSTVTRKITYSN